MKLDYKDKISVIGKTTRKLHTNRYKQIIDKLDNVKDKVDLIWNVTHSRKINKKQFIELLNYIN